ncbi:MAG: AsmA-like C-terminal region-containing protein [Planctomycetota bacterium]
MVSIQPIRVVCRAAFVVAILLISQATNQTRAQTSPLGDNGVVAPAAQKPITPPADGSRVKYWSTTWEFQSIDMERLQGRLKAIGIDLGLNVQGNVTVKLQVGIPWNSIGDGKAYRFDGSVSSRRLILDQLEITDFASSVSYRDGVLTLTQLSADVLDQASENNGKIQGRGALELVPRGDAYAELVVEHLGVHSITQLLTQFYPEHASWFPSDGYLSGQLNLQFPVKQIRQASEFKLVGKIAGREFQSKIFPPTDVELNGLVIESNRLKIKSFQVMSQNPIEASRPLRLRGEVDFPLANDGKFSLTLTGDDLPVEDVLRHYVQPDPTSSTLVQGKVDFQAKASGSVDGLWSLNDWSIDGAFASPSLRVVGLDFGTLEHRFQVTSGRVRMTPIHASTVLPANMRIGRLSMDYLKDDDALQVSALDLAVFGGSIAGTCQLPLRDEGDFLAELTLRRVSPVLRPPVEMAANASVQCQLDGDLRWRAPIVSIASPASHKGNATLTAQDIQFDRQKIGGVTAAVSLLDGKLSINASGNVVGGTIEIETKADLLASDTWADLSDRLRFVDWQFQGLDMSRMAELALGYRPSFSARAGGKMRIDRKIESPSTLPKTDFELSLNDVRFRTRLLSRQIKLQGQTDRNVVLIRSLVGDYGEGTLRVAGQVYPLDGQSRFHPKLDLQVGISRVRLDRSAWFLGEDVAKQLHGYATARASVTGYQESLRLRGSIEGRELRVNSLPIGAAHSGVIARLDLNHLAWSVHLPSIRSHVGGGQLEGEMLVKSSHRGGLDLDSTWKSQRVDFLRLMNQLGTSTSFAQGKVSGVLTIDGKDVEAIDDVTGRFNFRLEQTQGAAIPGLVAASQLLGPISLARQSFDVGEAKGVIGKGVVSVDEFWLGSDTALVRADGKLYVRSGRMDLQAMIATGDYGDVAVNFSKIAQQYAIQTLIPASAIVSVTEILRDRTLVVSVMGTTRNPIVRLRPVETFREETVRFLLREGRRLIVASIAAESADALDAF